MDSELGITSTGSDEVRGCDCSKAGFSEMESSAVVDASRASLSLISVEAKVVASESVMPSDKEDDDVKVDEEVVEESVCCARGDCRCCAKYSSCPVASIIAISLSSTDGFF